MSTPESFRSTVPQTTQMTAAEQIIASNNKQTNKNKLCRNQSIKQSITNML